MIRENITAIRRELPPEVKLVAVSKFHPVEAIREAYDAGQRVFGENRPQEFEKKAEAQRKMGEASILEMYLAALPEVVKNAAAPLAQTDKIVMYGDGNSSRLVKDVMQSSSQIIEGLKESTGIDIASLIAGYAGGKLTAAQQDAENKEA